VGGHGLEEAQKPPPGSGPIDDACQAEHVFRPRKAVAEKEREDDPRKGKITHKAKFER